MGLSLQTQIIALWSVFLFGMVFHSQLAFMPALYGENVAMPESTGKMPLFHLWGMLGFFAIPMIAISATVLYTSPTYRMIHFGLTLFYSVMNLAHGVVDLMVRPIEWYQIALMALVFLNGIALNIVAFQWMQLA
jgi:hypothetical protein